MDQKEKIKANTDRQLANSSIAKRKSPINDVYASLTVKQSKSSNKDLHNQNQQNQTNFKTPENNTIKIKKNNHNGIQKNTHDKESNKIEHKIIKNTNNEKKKYINKKEKLTSILNGKNVSQKVNYIDLKQLKKFVHFNDDNTIQIQKSSDRSKLEIFMFAELIKPLSELTVKGYKPRWVNMALLNIYKEKELITDAEYQSSVDFYFRNTKVYPLRNHADIELNNDKKMLRINLFAGIVAPLSFLDQANRRNLVAEALINGYEKQGIITDEQVAELRKFYLNN